MWYTSNTFKPAQKLHKSTKTKGHEILSKFMSAAYSNLAEKEIFQSHGVPICPSVLHTIGEPDVLIELALDNVLSVVGAHAGSLFIWDEFQKTFVLKASRGPYRDKMANAQIKLRQGILGTIGDQGMPVLVKNLHSDHRFQTLSRFHHYRSSSFIGIPLIVQNKLVGIVNITERENLIPFTDEDRERAELFARHIAVAMENLRLLRRVQNENDQLHHQVTTLSQSIKTQEALVSVGKLATNLTHELNNPLDAIRRYVNLALDQALEDSLTREYLLKAKKGIRRAIGVIRGLLQYSRELHHSGTRTIEIHGLIRESIQALEHHYAFRQIKIENHFVSRSLYVNDPGLPHVLKNLYQNAIDAMESEGTLKISTDFQNGIVIVSVEDTGSGITKQDLPRIFEPFFTTKAEGKGTGVGLTFCREIVEKTNGTITCESQEGKGTKFTLSLPCVA